MANVTEMCLEKIDRPAAWRAADMADPDEWTIHLREDDLVEFDRALAGVKQRGLSTLEIREEDFPLPGFKDTIDQMVREIEGGRGFVLVRGLPVHERYDMDETAMIYWAIGQHMGRAVPQNDRGHLLGSVGYKGPANDSADPTRRQYEAGGTPAQFHCDQTDVVGLLCYRKAKVGGESLLASAAEIHNVMLEERPDLLERLYDTYLCDRKGEELPGEPPYYPTQIFSYCDGLTSVRFSTRYIRDAQRFPDVPRLTPEQQEAMDYVDEIPQRPGMHLSMLMEEGDMQFVNNYDVVHGRNAYEDHEEPELRRNLLRLWVTLKSGGRKLVPDFEVRRNGIPQPEPV